MKATFINTPKGTWAYIQKSVRKDGKSTTHTVKKLGLLDDIKAQYGCEDPKEWVRNLALKMTEDEKKDNLDITISLSPAEVVREGDIPLRSAGDLFMLPVYNRLGLPDICSDILKDSRVKYDLDEILRTLVFSRVLSPCSKTRTFEFARHLVFPPGFSENDMFRSLSLLAGHINDIQAHMYKASKRFINRKERVLYFDCTNYYFEIEDNDCDYVDKQTGEVKSGLRRNGKSKEHRPNPIVQMGMFMDGDGIPLAFNIFPGNESEQAWLQPLEETLGRKFDLTEFVVSTDAGLASEGNRRYNMAEGRDYICVQSLPSLKVEDQKAALAREGWRIAYCGDRDRVGSLPTSDPSRTIFNLDELLEEESSNPGLLKDMQFYREILLEKTFRYENPEWRAKEQENKGGEHKDANGKPIPRSLSVKRNERIIVTYSHDYAMYLKHRREQRLKVARAIVKNKDDKGRQSKQSPRKYIKTVHRTKDGDIASKVDMVIDDEEIMQEAKFDGFYAYGTSLEDGAIDILKARSFHHEIEHLFRVSKSFLDARPVFLSNPERIKSHFLICFIAMVVLKVMQKQLQESYPDSYKDEGLSIDKLVEALRGFSFGNLSDRGYVPMFTRTKLTDQLQESAGVKVNTQIIKPKDMRKAYRSVK